MSCNSFPQSFPILSGVVLSEIGRIDDISWLEFSGWNKVPHKRSQQAVLDPH